MGDSEPFSTAKTLLTWSKHRALLPSPCQMGVDDSTAKCGVLNTGSFVLAVLLPVGVFVSYAPQLVKLYRAKSHIGVSMLSICAAASVNELHDFARKSIFSLLAAYFSVAHVCSLAPLLASAAYN